MSGLWTTITATDAEIRNRSLDDFCRTASTEQLLAEVSELERLRHSNENLYERVRALFFLYAIHRFHLPARKDAFAAGNALIPFDGYEKFLNQKI